MGEARPLLPPSPALSWEALRSTIDMHRDSAITPPSTIDRLARNLLFRTLGRIEHGVVDLVENGTTIHRFGRVVDDLQARIQVRDPRFYRRVVFGGNLGAGEAYMDGLWSCDQLTCLCRIVAANTRILRGVAPGITRLARPLRPLGHALRRNTRAGSRRNIEEHYDLGNDFYRLFLDDNLMYSSAIFPNHESSLEEASRHKVDTICRLLRLAPHDRVLEIGSGWGGFAIQAARDYGCRVVTTTISDAQFELANERVYDAGLRDRITVLMQDYRELTGSFDKIVSIEMIEAVGHQYLDTFFRKCSQLLQPDGAMLLQAITMADQRFEQHVRTVDFIKRHIFPGSCLPSVARMSEAVAEVTDFRIQHLRDIGQHYARTLAEWARRFAANEKAVRDQGFSDRFIRKWEFYLAYCEAGFAERYISNVQLLLTKPGYRESAVADAAPTRYVDQSESSEAPHTAGALATL